MKIGDTITLIRETHIVNGEVKEISPWTPDCGKVDKSRILVRMETKNGLIGYLIPQALAAASKDGDTIQY